MALVVDWVHRQYFGWVVVLVFKEEASYTGATHRVLGSTLEGDGFNARHVYATSDKAYDAGGCAVASATASDYKDFNVLFITVSEEEEMNYALPRV